MRRPAGLVLVENRDRYGQLLPVAIAGLAAMLVLAVFGLPPVDLHGPPHRLGIMDPGCGGTRGLRALGRGDVVAAWGWNPASVVLGFGAAVTLLRYAAGRVTGRWPAIAISRRMLGAAALMAVAALEVNQQLQAERLMVGM